MPESRPRSASTASASAAAVAASAGHDQDVQEAPVSISSLRSKFESLAAQGGAGKADGAKGAQGGWRKPLPTGASASLQLDRPPQQETVDAVNSSVPRTRSPSPSRATEGSVKAPSATSEPHREASVEVPAPAEPAPDVPVKATAPARPAGVRSLLPPSLPQASSSTSTLYVPSHTKEQPPFLSPAIAPTSSPLVVTPRSLSPQPTRRAPPSAPSRPPSRPSSRRSSRASSKSSSRSSGSDSRDDQVPPSMLTSVKALRERFAASQPSGDEVSSTVLRKAVTGEVTPTEPRSRSGNGSGNDNEQSTLKQSTAPIIRRTSTGGSSSTNGGGNVNGSGSGSGSGSGRGSNKSTNDSFPAPKPRKPAPPPPPISRTGSPAQQSISRTHSPAPPPPDRSTKPSHRVVPATIPPPPDSDVPILPPTQTEHSHVPPPPPSVPPALPARKATLPSMATPPPAPPISSSNKLGSSSLPTVVSHALDEHRPQVPSRARASTLAVADDSKALPPKLPARTNTPHQVGSVLAPPVPPGLVSPQRSRNGSISSDVLPRRHHSLLHREHAHSIDDPAAHSWLQRHRDGSSTSLSDYLPPPPPQRSVAPTASTPPRREYTREKEGDEDSDDDDDEASQATSFTGAVKRAMEDYPDSTHANRRPPRLVPDIHIGGAQPVNAFAVHGRHVCTGSHMVRVYDTLMSDRPIFTVDLRETGLEFRIKDPKVTAMSFRPAPDAADEGRYLWCGTKDGHLWELDIKTGKVTETRAYAHASAVIYIFRHQHYVLTLEEGGKLCVFDTNDKSTRLEDRYVPTLLRTVRVSDKLNFAKMIRGKLWTSTGPAARSTTSAASKGPTIRVHQPCVEGASPPPTTMFTSEWTGAVTSATVMPMKPDEVLLGHEGGFVSIWNAADMTCVQVLKISATDILSLEGVGDRLWAGNRKGQIHVYDITERPWLTTNVWLAHREYPITCLTVDPWSPEQSGRFCLWSCTRDSLRAWDGLLSVDWIDKQMELRQEDYCSFRDINILVCSWNIDSAKPTDLSGKEANATFLNRVLTSVESPDIIVFGFQEVIPLSNKKLTAKTLLFGGKNKDGTTDDKVSYAYRQWLDKLTSAVRAAAGPDCPYVKIHSESLVGLFTSIFVKSSEKDGLRDMDICTVKRGIGGIYGNKGAIIARLVIDDTSLCFINVHLAAGQSQKADRNADLGGIMEDKAIFSPADDLPFVHGGDGTAILDHEMVILNGDLNYRIDQRRENVLSSIAANDLAFLLEHDQLRREMRTNHSFRLRSFDEPPIQFPPTYKYDKGSDEYDNSEKRRIPAWCDRILHTKSPRIQTLHYQRYETTASDHKPISAGFKMTIKAVDSAKMVQVRREVGAEWAKREAEVLGRMAAAFEKLL